MRPLPFIVEQLSGIEPGDALDVACGEGRHLSVLAQRGFRCTGIDRDEDLLREAAIHAPGATLIVRDVEANGLPEDFRARFDLVLTTFYLHRPLIEPIARALRPGGRWIVETFHVENHLRGGHPRRRWLAYEAGEARRLAQSAGLEVRLLDEGDHDGLFTTRLVARLPGIR